PLIPVAQKGRSPLCVCWDQGLHPRHPRKPPKEKNHRFFLCPVINRGSDLGMTKKEIVKRQKEIKIRLTDEEHQALLDRCTTASLASWMREICLSEKRTKQSKVIEVDPKLLRQLAGIGNNLNQIARLVNQQSKTSSAIDRIAIITALSGIERELQRLHNDHKNT
ncbi:MobC family plasmid mobilization relaxosome protein, partial [Acinetobacter lwoffii]|uniref:MobC family plasmid mobilization relaxosome protein n=1 Tax=Acinetobacter lwoffii TaxID=28090 RepID=UPI00209B3858